MKRITKTRACRARAFTLIEILIAITIFSLVVIGVISSTIFGLRLYEIAKTKLGISTYSRRALSTMMTDIREAGLASVGTGSATNFVEAAAGTAHQGNALQINPIRNNTNMFIRYYRDEEDQCLKMVSDTNTIPVVVASYVSNSVVFAEEDFRGTVLTNRQAASVIAVNLSFFKIETPPVLIGEGGFYEYYGLQTRVSRRSTE